MQRALGAIHGEAHVDVAAGPEYHLLAARLVHRPVADYPEGLVRGENAHYPGLVVGATAGVEAPVGVERGAGRGQRQ
uniref:Uncharacterized protein n=1 Tax=Tanacetum cinerariifolium TaxID=118510 RepID=A0A699TKB0_TANCI|nr:hypothetical protein [Tanacetum cinerariifolium]